MKNTFLIILTSIIMLTACQNEFIETEDNNYKNLSISELAKELALDPVFSSHKEQTLNEVYRISGFFVE